MMSLIVLFAAICYLVGYVLISALDQTDPLTRIPAVLFVPMFLLGLLLRVCGCALILILVGG